MGFWNDLMSGKRSFEKAMGPVSYQAGGIKLVCPHCHSDGFFEGRRLMNTAGMTFFGLDWAEKEVTILTCGRCGLVPVVRHSAPKAFRGTASVWVVAKLLMSPVQR